MKIVFILQNWTNKQNGLKSTYYKEITCLAFVTWTYVNLANHSKFFKKADLKMD